MTQSPAPHPGQPAEGLAVTARHFPLKWMLALFKPAIMVNGYRIPNTGWGRTVVPTQPGRHHVHVHIPYWLPPQIGMADATVDVHPGQLVELEYKAPMYAFMGGSLGYPPQSYNGVGRVIGVIAVFAFFFFMAIVLPALMLLMEG